MIGRPSLLHPKPTQTLRRPFTFQKPIVNTRAATMSTTSPTKKMPHARVGERRAKTTTKNAGGGRQRKINSTALPATQLVATSQSVQFLEALRPGGPWWLNAFPPERGGEVEGELAKNAAEIDRFVAAHNGKLNIYFTLNPLRGAPKSRKPSKLDIAAVEYLQADLDPRDDESPKEAKARYAEAIEGSGRQPFMVVDSGNGLQALFRVERIELPGEFVKDEEDKQVYAPAVLKVVDDTEARIKAFLLYLGGTTGTQNVDRILRLPGTINLPNAKKLRDGRVECQSELIELNADAPVYAPEDFPLDAPPRHMNGHGHEADDLRHLSEYAEESEPKGGDQSRSGNGDNLVHE
jgi:hypothetical protein